LQLNQEELPLPPALDDLLYRIVRYWLSTGYGPLFVREKLREIIRCDEAIGDVDVQASQEILLAAPVSCMKTRNWLVLLKAHLMPEFDINLQVRDSVCWHASRRRYGGKALGGLKPTKITVLDPAQEELMQCWIKNGSAFVKRAEEGTRALSPVFVTTGATPVRKVVSPGMIADRAKVAAILASGWCVKKKPPKTDVGQVTKMKKDENPIGRPKKVKRIRGDRLPPAEMMAACKRARYAVRYSPISDGQGDQTVSEIKSSITLVSPMKEETVLSTPPSGERGGVMSSSLTSLEAFVGEQRLGSVPAVTESAPSYHGAMHWPSWGQHTSVMPPGVPYMQPYSQGGGGYNSYATWNEGDYQWQQ
jgi:hypothetical protein